jgi:glycosyltransferase involved in cell wall biosynthesis
MAAALALARRVRPLGVRHIHAHMAHVPATIAMYAARQLGIGFSFTGHANDIFPNRTLLAEKLRRARFAACISEWHREFYRCVSGVPESRLPVVRCGVEIPAAAPVEREGVPRIVAVGRLMPKKGFDVLVRAVAELRAAGVGVECRIIGAGPQREELAGLIRERGLTGTVALLGAMANERVLDEIAGADLFVLPCRVDPGGDRDGIPVVLMEAMARGVCVISGDLPAIRELVRHGETGLMVSPGEVGPLAAAIRTALADKALRRRVGEQGRAWVADEFSSGVNADRLIAAFTWAVSAERSPACAV